MLAASTHRLRTIGDTEQCTVGEEEGKEEEEEEETLRFFNNTAGPQVLLQVCETEPEASTPPTVSETWFFRNDLHHTVTDSSILYPIPFRIYAPTHS